MIVRTIVCRNSPHFRIAAANIPLTRSLIRYHIYQNKIDPLISRGKIILTITSYCRFIVEY